MKQRISSEEVVKKLAKTTVRLPKVSTNGITLHDVILPRLGCKMNNISLIRVELLPNLCSYRKKSLTLYPKTRLCHHKWYV